MLQAAGRHTLGLAFFGRALSAFSNQPLGVNEETQIHMKQVSNIVQPHMTDFTPPPLSSALHPSSLT